MDGIPTIYEFLGYLDFMRGTPAAYIVLLTASLILILRDWRLLLITLIIQYLVVGLLFADVLLPHLAFMKVLVGAFICLMLYITARQVNWGQLPEDVTEDEVVRLNEERLVRVGPYMMPTETPLRVFLALIVALTVWALSQRTGFHLPVVPAHLNVAVMALVGMGLITLSLTSEPLKFGLGLLTFWIGFELFYSAVEPSIAMLVMLSIADLIIVLAISYLIQARHSLPVILD